MLDFYDMNLRISKMAQTLFIIFSFMKLSVLLKEQIWKKDLKNGVVWKIFKSDHTNLRTLRPPLVGCKESIWPFIFEKDSIDPSIFEKDSISPIELGKFDP